MHVDLEFATDGLLDRLQERFKSGTTATAIDELARKLQEVRCRLGPARWEEFLSRHRTGHALVERLRQGPVTGRSFRKPRGYAGDAETIDLIYAQGVDSSSWSDEVQSIYRWELRAPASRAVRERARLLGFALDDMAREKPSMTALSVACGHLREARHSRAVAEGRLGRLFALDQDPRALAVAERDHPPVVEAVQGSVRQLLSKRVAFSNIDLVWSAGLYDYLGTSLAQGLTKVLFEMLAPSGRLLLVNFTPELPDIGYMDLVMDWRLIYRSEENMVELLEDIPEAGIGEIKTFREPSGHLVFLQVSRRA